MSSKQITFWEKDVSFSEVIHQILELYKKYTLTQRKKVILSFSWGEPTLNKHLKRYISLAKQIGVWTVQIQTNGSILFVKKQLLEELISAWLDEVFLAQHSSDENINKTLWVLYRISDFIDWIQYVKEKELYKQVSITLNIVVTKVNISYVPEYIAFSSSA